MMLPSDAPTPADGSGDGSVEPGTVRPGGRTARVRAAVLQAAGDMLAEQGFHALDLAEVARRAEVGKTTVYRRWGTVTGLVADLLTDMAEQSLPRADTGSLEQDLLANAELVRRTLSDPRQGPLFKAVIAAATGDARTAEALHRFYEIRVAEWAHCVQDAIARGGAGGHRRCRGGAGRVSPAVLPAADHGRSPGRSRGPAGGRSGNGSRPRGSLRRDAVDIGPTLRRHRQAPGPVPDQRRSGRLPPAAGPSG